MKFFMFAFLFFILFNYLIVFSFQEVNSTFQATHEWQRVEKGQTLPPGLWLRIDFQSNIREAKIPNEEELRAMGLFDDEDLEDDEEIQMETEELKEILRNGTPKEDLKEKKIKKYRSILELKKEFKHFNIDFRTDFDILSNIVFNFKRYNFNKMILPNGETSKLPDDDEVLTFLVDLEYLVHLTDNAKEFARLNGFVEVIHKCLNSTSSEIRAEALKLHGSATQSNPDTQIAAFEAGSIPLLLKVLSHDADVNVQARCMYALASLIRQFPAAQYKFIYEGGLSVIATFFHDDHEDLLRLQLKVAVLFQDLLLERKDVVITIYEEEEKEEETQFLMELRERNRQYEEIDLELRLVELNWCERIVDWILKQDLMVEFERSTDIGKDLSPHVSDLHELIHKMMDTVYVMSDICRMEFRISRELLELVCDLEELYNILAAIETEDDKNYNNIYSNLVGVLGLIKNRLRRSTLREEKY